MKRILAIGIVLLALLALTGVVSGADTATADVRADILVQSIDLTVTNYIGSSWSMGVGDNIVGNGQQNTGIGIECTKTGYPNGVTITIADKLDYSKPAGTEGKMVSYGALAWGQKTLTNPIQFDSNAPFVTPGFHPVSGSETIYAVIPGGAIGIGGNGLLKQTVVSSDSSDSYRIVLTFTATPN